jgi:hypothetical protein
LDTEPALSLVGGDAIDPNARCAQGDDRRASVWLARILTCFHKPHERKLRVARGRLSRASLPLRELNMHT